MKKRLFSLMLALVMLFTMLPQISLPIKAVTALPNSIYTAQNTDYTCTLASITMMIRARMYLSGNDDWNQITESSMRPVAWREGVGALWEFTYYSNGNTISTFYKFVSGISISDLKAVLDNHPEGIVAYSGNRKHAVLITDYEGDRFYCADPAGSYSGKRIPLDESYLAVKCGGGQDAVLRNITVYSYVSAYSIIPTCNHSYNNLGICTSACKQEYNWQATYDTSCAGIYKVSLSGGIYLRTDKPYTASTAKSSLIKKDTEVKVLGSVTNHYETDNKWYKVTYNGVVGYTNANNLTWVRENDKQPLAVCDEVVGKDGSVYIRGWAFDPDTPSECVAIHVYIDDGWAGAYTADTGRPDVNDVYGCGNNHGFDFTVPCEEGTHSVVVFAINTAYGEDPKGMGPFDVTVSSHTHTYTNKVTTAATCTTAGVRTFTCDSCADSYTESIAATGHSYSKWITTTAAGCTTTGIEKKTCSSCGDVQTRSIAATGHNYQSSIIDATPNDYEKIRYTCSKCQYYYEEYINGKYSEWSTTKPTGVAENLIETKTQYRYRSISYSTEYTEWGAWSSWQDSSVSETPLRDVETQTLYPYYYFYCMKCGDSTRWYAYGGSCGACGTTIDLSSGTVVWLTIPWSEATSYQPFGIDTGKYAIIYNGLTYWKWTDGSPTTQYRYRTRSSYQATNYGDWSNWGDTAYSNTASREVQTRTVYRYVSHLDALDITTQPTNKIVKVGTTAKFSVQATGRNLSYQWQYRTSSSGSWKNASATGNKTATLSVPASVSRNGYQYRCRITDSAGNKVYTKTVTLNVLGIKTQPINKIVKAGTTAKFTVKATGKGLTYQWQYRTSSDGSWKNASASSAKTASYKVSAEARHNGYQYRCRITDSAGNKIYTKTVTLNVLSIKTQPTNKIVKAGTTAKFTVKATGKGLTYQWQYRTSSKGSWKNASASSAKTASYKVSAAVKHNGYQYRCRITDSAGNKVYTKIVTLNVLGIKTQPASKTVYSGATAKFTVKAVGKGLSFQWQYRTSSKDSWKSVSASSGKTASYSLAAKLRHNGYQYRCKITDSDGNVIYTNIVKLTVKK